MLNSKKQLYTLKLSEKNLFEKRPLTYCSVEMHI
jgi:hypothetical protein